MVSSSHNEYRGSTTLLISELSDDSNSDELSFGGPKDMFGAKEDQDSIHQHRNPMSEVNSSKSSKMSSLSAGSESSQILIAEHMAEAALAVSRTHDTISSFTSD